MTVKKESTGRRSVQVEVEVPGTPEEVWRAIATGPGVSSWFVPTTIEERLGGKLSCHFGPGMDSNATITSWEPPVRFAAEEKWAGEEGPSFATEWFVEARSGGVCVVRVVHSLFSETDDWDNQLEGTETGWPVYFRVLRLYLSQYNGQYGKTMIALGFSQGTEAQAWNKLRESLGLTGTSEGEACTTASASPQLSGIVEWDNQHSIPPALMIRLKEPAPGIAMLGASNCGGSIQIAVTLYLYGDKASNTVGVEQPKWQDWLKEHFPAVAPDPS